MAYSQILRNANFICAPNNMVIDVEFPISSRNFVITLKVDNTIAMKSRYNTTVFPKKQNDYDDGIVSFCTYFMLLEEDDLYSHAENYMCALNAHRNLKKVLSRSGKTVWEKP